MSTKEKIFVTGGNGFIGSRVVKKLTEEGYEVKCLLRTTSKTKRIDNLNYERFEGDITNPESLEKGMEGCTGIIHLASLSNWDDIHSPMMHKVVVEGSQNVIKAAQKSGNLKMVYVSSTTAINGTDELVMLNETSPFSLDPKTFSYPNAKKKVEGMCIEASKEGLPVTIVNPTEVYGPNDYDQITSGNLIDFAKTKPVQICKGGTSIVHVDDVATGIIAAMEKGKPGERYILGGENLSFYELASLTLDILKLNHKVKIVPRNLLKFLAWMSRTFKINFGFNPAVIPYAVKYWYVDNSKAQKELGVSFRSPREILEPTLQWIQEEKLI